MPLGASWSRNQSRDAFSHADSSKILADFPENIKVYKGKFQENGEKKEVKMNPKKVPFLNAVLVEQFAKDNALDYYNFVFKLIFEIEKRLINKYNYVQWLQKKIKKKLSNWLN